MPKTSMRFMDVLGKVPFSRRLASPLLRGHTPLLLQLNTSARWTLVLKTSASATLPRV
jgi:hypothetical protein